MTEDRPHWQDEPRTRMGKWAKSLESAERDAEAARLWGRGWTYEAISDHLGYGDKANALRAVRSALKAVQAEGVNEARTAQLALIGELKRHALDVLETDHVMVSHGKVIKDDDGNPLLDDGPRLAAIGKLETLIAREAALLGTPMPTRSKLEIGGDDERERELLAQIERLKAQRRGEPPEEPEPDGDGEIDGP
jgi:hypothetical protein